MKNSNQAALVELIHFAEKSRGPSVALAEAARWTLLEQIDRLLAAGVPADARLDKNATPLMCAGTKRSAQRLLKAGADPNAVDDEGCTPLIWFFKGLYKKNEALSRIKLLQQHGADLHAKDHAGKSALDYATPKYDAEVLALLR